MSHNLDTLATDFDTVRSRLIDILRDYNLIKDLHKSSTGIVLIELLSYVTELLNYYINEAKAEMSIETAQKRDSLLKLAKSFGYNLFYGAPARGEVAIVFDVPLSADKTVEIPQYTYLQSREGVNFMVTENYTWRYDQNPEGSGTGNLKVRQGLLRKAAIGTSKGAEFEQFKIPSRYVTIPNTYDADLADPTFYITTVTTEGVEAEWTYKETLIYSSFDDRHFTVELDEDNYVWIKFGDGNFGKIPDVGATVNIFYEEHAGTYGNIDGVDMTLFNTNNLAYYNADEDNTRLTLESMSAQTFGNGRDPDGDDTIRQNVQTWERLQGRAVSIQDFEEGYQMHKGVLRGNVIGYNALYEIASSGFAWTSISAIAANSGFALLSGYYDRPWQYIEVSGSEDEYEISAASGFALQFTDIWTENLMGTNLVQDPNFDIWYKYPLSSTSAGLPIGISSGWFDKIIWTDNITVASGAGTSAGIGRPFMGALSATVKQSLNDWLQAYFPPLINVNVFHYEPTIIWINLNINVEKETGWAGTEESIKDDIYQVIWENYGFNALDSDSAFKINFDQKLYLNEIENTIFNNVDGIVSLNIAGGPSAGFLLNTIESDTTFDTSGQIITVTAQPFTGNYVSAAPYTSGYGVFYNTDERSLKFKRNQFPIINVSAINFT